MGQQRITVVVTARDQSKADSAAEKLKAENIDAYGVALDVSDSSHYSGVIEFLDKQLASSTSW